MCRCTPQAPSAALGSICKGVHPASLSQMWSPVQQACLQKTASMCQSRHYHRPEACAVTLDVCFVPPAGKLKHSHVLESFPCHESYTTSQYISLGSQHDCKPSTVRVKGAVNKKAERAPCQRLTTAAAKRQTSIYKNQPKQQKPHWPHPAVVASHLQ